jgi:predicted enzyme related to lactoylglutathione lyase
MSRVVHFEIHASNPEKLSAFYANVFGWKVNHLPQMDYWLLETGTGDGINGGLMKRRGARAAEGAPVNAFVCSIGVESAAESFKRALAAGATQALPLGPIPGIGWQAYINDPDGNLVGIHQPDPSAR